MKVIFFLIVLTFSFQVLADPDGAFMNSKAGVLMVTK